MSNADEILAEDDAAREIENGVSGATPEQTVRGLERRGRSAADYRILAVHLGKLAAACAARSDLPPDTNTGSLPAVEDGEGI